MSTTHTYYPNPSQHPASRPLNPGLSEAAEAPLRARGLRMVLVAAMMDQGEVTVAELVNALSEAGFAMSGRPSKVISDALRWEVRRGRVVRLGRGRYCYRSAPPSTARRIRTFAVRCRAWLVAVTRGETPPPVPPDTRTAPQLRRPSGILLAPWEHLGWLWVM